MFLTDNPYCFMKRIAPLFLLIALLLPLSATAAVAPVHATFGGAIAQFFKGSYDNNRFIVDTGEKYVRGNVHLTTPDGENVLGFDGTVDPKTHAISATLSGADDWSYFPDRTQKTVSYLRTAYDGTWNATLAPRSGSAPYVWSGPASMTYITVISRQTPDGVVVPQEKKTYTGTLTLTIDSDVLGDSLAGETIPPPLVAPVEKPKPVVATTSTLAATSSAVVATGTPQASPVATSTPPIAQSNGSGGKWLIVLGILIALIVIGAIAWPKKHG